MKTPSKEYIIELGTNNHILRKPSKSIDKLTKDLIVFGNDLLDMMRKWKGVGLAAPQVGENLRIIATTQRQGKGKKMKFKDEILMINPQIIAKSPALNVDQEACLSLPDVVVDVARHNSVTVRFLNLDNKIQTEMFSGFNARIVQHEIDHIDGILIVDRGI